MQLASALRGIHWVVLAMIYGFFWMKATYELQVGGDFLGWHLPGALQMIGKTTYISYNQSVINGYPPFLHFLSAICIAVTSNIYASQWIGLIVLGGAMIVLSQLFSAHFSVRWFLTIFLAFPIFIHSLPTGLLDLPTGILLMLSVAGIYSMQKGIQPYFGATVSGICLILSLLSKLTAWPVVVCLTPFVCYQFVRTFGKKVGGVVCLITLLTLTIFPFVNTLKFQNPTYPYPLPFIGNFLDLPGRNIGDPNEQSPKQLHHSIYPIRFIYSLFEVSRFTHTEKTYTWNGTHMSNGGSNSPHYRIGGYFYITVVLTILIVILCLKKGVLRIAEITPFMTSIGLFSLLHKSTEMRYSLFIGVTCVFFVVLGIEQLTKKIQIITRAGFVVIAIYCSFHLDPDFWRIDRRSISDLAPIEAQQFWDHQQQLPIEEREKEIVIEGKKNLSIFWSGPTFNEYYIRAKY